MIDTYITYLRDVRRVSPNTVESYARDLAALAGFAEARETPVEELDRRALEAFVRSLMTQGLSPRSVARSVACVRGFYRFLSLERKLDESPAADLKAPRAWPALPKFLDLDEVDRLLAQPDVSTPRGLRDKALIEVLYASGMRVSELVGVKPGELRLDEGYLTCLGKGDKERIVPLGDQAVDWLRRYISDGRSRLTTTAFDAVAVRQRAWWTAVSCWRLEITQDLRAEGRDHPRDQPARASTFVRYPSPRARRRPPSHPGDAGACGSVDDADIHACARSAASGGVRQVPSEALK